jgi:protein-disulfide isomerase
MKKLVFTAAVAFVLAACSGDETGQEAEPENTDDAVEEETEEGTIDMDYVSMWQEENGEYLSGRPAVGDDDAPVTIVKFSDFKCPYCADWKEDMYPWLKEEYIDPGTAKLVFVHFPSLGEDAETAAQAGEAIFQQDEDAFWEYYELMYEHQEDPSEEWATEAFILDLAEDIPGVEIDQLREDMQSDEAATAIEEDQAFAAAGSVTGTPTVVIDGYSMANGFDKESIAHFFEVRQESGGE